jgi:hypothetical protein
VLIELGLTWSGKRAKELLGKNKIKAPKITNATRADMYKTGEGCLHPMMGKEPALVMQMSFPPSSSWGSGFQPGFRLALAQDAWPQTLSHTNFWRGCSRPGPTNFQSTSFSNLQVRFGTCLHNIGTNHSVYLCLLAN